LEQLDGSLSAADPAIINHLEPELKQPPLYFAAIHGSDDSSVELFRLLISRGADYRFKDLNEQTVLFYVCKLGTRIVTQGRSSA
jgi:ankyrin repeat protein